VQVRIVQCAQVDRRWSECRAKLWPEASATLHHDEVDRLLQARTPFTAWLALATDDVAGFAEARLRNDPVNGCETSPVAFLEGLWVAPPYRRQGIASQLIAAAENWARGLGCSELASDALLDNAPSHAVHVAAGFEETERVVCFRKRLFGASDG
jgi:aminoglycoside 6'-N-acetyltransferase I